LLDRHLKVTLKLLFSNEGRLARVQKLMVIGTILIDQLSSVHMDLLFVPSDGGGSSLRAGLSRVDLVVAVKIVLARSECKRVQGGHIQVVLLGEGTE
jgi:hypothetical protein